jgi:hypothetical protein
MVGRRRRVRSVQSREGKKNARGFLCLCCPDIRAQARGCTRDTPRPIPSSSATAYVSESEQNKAATTRTAQLSRAPVHSLTEAERRGKTRRSAAASSGDRRRVSLPQPRQRNFSEKKCRSKDERLERIRAWPHLTQVRMGATRV